MKNYTYGKGGSFSIVSVILVLLLSVIGVFSSAHVYAFSTSVNVLGVNKDGTTAALANFRWLIEEDNTSAVNIGSVLDPDSLSLNFHASHAPVIARGDEKDHT